MARSALHVRPATVDDLPALLAFGDELRDVEGLFREYAESVGIESRAQASGAAGVMALLPGIENDDAPLHEYLEAGQRAGAELVSSRG